MNRKNQDFQKDYKRIVHETIDRPKVRDRILFRPQHEFLCNDHGEIMVGPLSGNTKHCNRLTIRYAKNIDVPSNKLQLINSSQHNHYSSYYDDELIEKIALYYKRDLELFDYTFPRK